MSYWEDQKLEFFPSGAQVLDCCLGGNGWAVGSVINIIGDKSTGKCCKNAYIISENGMQLIDDIGNSLPYGSSNYSVKLTTDSKNTDISEQFWKEKVSESIKITTRHGFELEATNDHKIKVWTKNCTYEMKSMKDLAVGDVAIISKSPIYQQNSYYKINYTRKPLSNRVTNFNFIKIPKYLNEQIGYFIGLLIADGNIYPQHNNVTLSNNKSWFEINLTKILEEEFDIEHSPENHAFKDNSEGITHNISSKDLANFLVDLLQIEEGSFTARFKRVPNCILESPKSVQASFLKAIFDCDSDSGDSCIALTSASEHVAKTVQLMLLNFGIVASKLPKFVAEYPDHTYWKVYIPSIYANKYMEIIGSEKYEGKTFIGEANSDFEVIPFLYDRMIKDRDELREKLGWSINGRITHPDFLKAGIRYFPRMKLNCWNMAQVSLIERYLNHLKPFEELYNHSFYEDLLTSTYHYDPIETIEYIKSDYEFDVHDFCIPNTHLFWTNGFISHNTAIALEALANHAKTWPDPVNKRYYAGTETSFDLDYFKNEIGIPIDKDNLDNIATVEDLVNHYDTKLSTQSIKTHGLYILDSLDGLSTEAELERDISEGSFKLDKPKMMGELFRRLSKIAEKKNNSLFIISQVRDKINSTFPIKIRSGGKSLDFWAGQVLWLSETGKDEVTIDKVKRVTALKVKVKCTKNKVGRAYRTCDLRILIGYGIDDLTSNMLFLLEAGSLDRIKANISLEASEAGIGKFVKKAFDLPADEFNRLRSEVAEITKIRWNEIEDKLKVKHSKYGPVTPTA